MVFAVLLILLFAALCLMFADEVHRMWKYRKFPYEEARSAVTGHLRLVSINGKPPIKG